MIRPMLAVAAGLLCGVAGLRQSRRMRSDCQRLTDWAALLTRLALLMEESALSLPEAFEQAVAAREHPLHRLAAEMRLHPLKPLPALFAALNLSGPETAPLSRLMEQLARGSLDSRVLAVRQAAAEIGLLASASREKAGQDARMWATLGWTGGACLTLLLL